jgi:hypothetical protein
LNSQLNIFHSGTKGRKLSLQYKLLNLLYVSGPEVSTHHWHLGSSLFFSLFLAEVLFELRASFLQGRHSTTWLKPPALCALDILEIWSPFLPRLMWTTVLLYNFHWCWYDRHRPQNPAFLSLWDGSFLLFYCVGIYCNIYKILKIY